LKKSKDIILSNVLYYLIVTLLGIAVLFYAYRLFTRNLPLSGSLGRDRIEAAEEGGDEQGEAGDSEDGTALVQGVLVQGAPVLLVEEKEGPQNILAEIWSWITRKDKINMKSILAFQMSALYGFRIEEEQQSALNLTDSGQNIEDADKETVSSRGDGEERPPDLFEGEEELYLTPDVEIPEEIQIEINKIKDDMKPVLLTGEGPQILIYHTHTREAYAQDPSRPYKEVESFRCNDLNYTVAKVGEVVSKKLAEKGIQVLHDTTEHEQAKFYTSYSRSLKTIQKRLKEYPSIKIIIDIHRDAHGSGGNKDRDIVVINGKRVAKVMAVVATGEGRVVGYKEKPNWKENYKFAQKLTNALNRIHPGLGREIRISKDRYNQHACTPAILLEVGSNLTTLTEAERAGEYIAEALSQIVEK